jgi:tetratricopeptide (TPR) repeat protein
VRRLGQADADARRAIAIAPKLGTPHSALGFIELLRLNFKSSYRQMQQALLLSPNDPHVIGNAAAKMAAFGDGPGALRTADRLVELDPLAPGSYQVRAIALWSMRRYPQAIDAAREALQLDPAASHVHFVIANCLMAMNELVKAQAEYEKLPADEPLRLFLEGLAAARFRDLRRMETTITQMRKLYGASYSFQYADIYAQSGNKERAFSELANALRAEDPGLAEMKSDPYLDPLRNDPRYAELIRRLNFP